MYITGVLVINTSKILFKTVVKTYAILYTTMNMAVNLFDILNIPVEKKL